MSDETINGVQYYLISNSYYSIGKNGSSSSGVTSKSISGTIIIPRKIKGRDILEFAKDAFHGCPNLTKIIIHAKLRSIGGYCFYGCTSLKYINIPPSVTFIGSYSLYLGTGYKNVSLEMTVEFVKKRTQRIYIKSNAFRGRDIFSFIYPSNIVPRYSGSPIACDSVIICAPSSFSFCSKQTTVGFSQCPAASYIDPFFKGKTCNTHYNNHFYIAMIIMIVS